MCYRDRNNLVNVFFANPRFLDVYMKEGIVDYILSNDSFLKEFEEVTNHSREKILHVFLWWACEEGHSELVRLLLKDGRADPTYLDNISLKSAIRTCEIDVVGLLLKDERVDPTAEDSQALRWAAENGHTDVVKLLLDDGRANPAARDSYALRWAAINGHADIVKLLLDDGYVLLPARQWVNLYAATSIPVGTQLIAENIGSTEVRLFSGATAPTDDGQTDGYVLLTAYSEKINETGNNGAWAFSFNSGVLNVRAA